MSNPTFHVVISLRNVAEHSIHENILSSVHRLSTMSIALFVLLLCLAPHMSPDFVYPSFTTAILDVGFQVSYRIIESYETILVLEELCGETRRSALSVDPSGGKYCVWAAK